MHLADFSYTERFTQNAFALGLFITYLGITTGFEDIRVPERRYNIKMAVFTLTMCSLVGWLIFDIMAMRVKYQEWRDPAAKCMPTAHTLYSKGNRDLLVGIKYYFNMVWTCHSSGLFLLLVFLENLVKPYKIHLASSREYAAYKIWAPLRHGQPLHISTPAHQHVSVSA